MVTSGVEGEPVCIEPSSAGVGSVSADVGEGVGAFVGAIEGLDMAGAGVGAIEGLDVTGAGVDATVGFDVVGVTVAGVGAMVGLVVLDAGVGSDAGAVPGVISTQSKFATW